MSPIACGSWMPGASWRPAPPRNSSAPRSIPARSASCRTCGPDDVPDNNNHPRRPMMRSNVHLRLAVAAVALGALALPARADQLGDIMQRKELRCGTFADVPPFAAPDPKTREMVGFDVDLCTAIAR